MSPFWSEALVWKDEVLSKLKVFTYLSHQRVYGERDVRHIMSRLERVVKVDKGEACLSVLQWEEFWQLLSSWICLLGYSSTTLLGCSAEQWAVFHAAESCSAVQWQSSSSRASSMQQSSSGRKPVPAAKPAWSAFLLGTPTTEVNLPIFNISYIFST